MRFLPWLGLTSLCLWWGYARFFRAEEGREMLSVGALAPDITGRDANDQPVALSTVRGSPAVVYFYPKDSTPGCTQEACAFREAFAAYTARGVRIFGVSGDSEESHRRFRAKHRLPFLLVSDTNGGIARAYGVSTYFGMPARVTFLVGRDGRILRRWENVDPGLHATDVLAALGPAEGGQAEGNL